MNKNKRVDISNLSKTISTGIITVFDVRSECKLSSDYTERTVITPEKFMESLEFLSNTIFKDAIDFYYDIKTDNCITVRCGMKNAFMEEIFFAECKIKDDMSMDEVEKMMRRTIFDDIAEKIGGGNKHE